MSHNLGNVSHVVRIVSHNFGNMNHNIGNCYGLQIRPMEEQLKQRVIGNDFLFLYDFLFSANTINVLAEKGSHTKEILAVLGLQSVCQMSRKEREVFSPGRANMYIFGVW